MQKFTCAIFGFFAILLVIQELIPQVECARVRVVKVKRTRHDKRQTQQQLRGYSDVPLDSSYDNSGSRKPSRPEENPYNAGNRNVDYPTRIPNTNTHNDDGRYNAAQAGSRKPSKSTNNDFGDDHCEGCDGNGIPGEAGTDYPIFATVPKTNFDCKKQEWPGYYADTEARCQVFWICQPKHGDAFLCPNGTLFNQQVYTCDWWYNVDCAAAPDYYTRNQYIYAGPGVDLYGNQISIRQSTSVSTKQQGNENDFATSRRPRPIQSQSQPQPQATSRPATVVSTNINKNSYSRNAGSTREILQAIESGTQTGAGGNAYRREISNRDDSQSSYSSNNGRNPERETRYSSSRQTPTTILPFEAYSSSNSKDFKKAASSDSNNKRRDDDNDGQSQSNYGDRRDSSINTAYAAKPHPIRENQIQNPFVNQSVPATSPRQSITTTGSGSSSSKQNYYPLREPSPAYSPPQPNKQQYNDNYSTTKSNYSPPKPESNDNGAYLPTASSRTNNNNNPFISSYKSSQTSSSRSNQGGNYYLGGTTTKRNVLESDKDFENDYEDGYKFNFAKTISYSPSAASSGITQVRSPISAYEPISATTTPRTIKASNIAGVVYRPDPIVITTTKKTPIFSQNDDSYAVKILRQPVIVKDSETSYRQPVNNYDDHDSRRSTGNSYGRHKAGSGEVDQYNYQPQTAESRHNSHHYNTQNDKYSNNNSGNNFQGGKIVTKYSTKTSYNDGDDDNYVNLLRSLAKSETASATTTPVPLQRVDNYDFATTHSTSTSSTTTTTAPPLFGKKIKSGRKRNTSNWQNYFFKSKN